MEDDQEIRFVVLPPEHDPDSLIKEKGAQAFEDASLVRMNSPWRFTPEHIKEITRQGYTVVCDEELSLIEAFKLGKEDLNSLHNHKLLEKDTQNLGKMKFLDEEMSYEAKYGQVKKLCVRKQVRLWHVQHSQAPRK